MEQRRHQFTYLEARLSGGKEEIVERLPGPWISGPQTDGGAS